MSDPPQTAGRGELSTFILLLTRIPPVTGAEHYFCLLLAFPFMSYFSYELLCDRNLLTLYAFTQSPAIMSQRVLVC